MDWINGLINIHSALQGVIIVSLVCAAGLALGKIRFAGVSLGVAFVFFVGIAVGNFGLNINAQMLNYCETFGLVLFVVAPLRIPTISLIGIFSVYVRTTAITVPSKIIAKDHIFCALPSCNKELKKLGPTCRPNV